MEGSSEVVLPQVLEDVLALKNQRALELGMEEAPAEETSSAPTQEKDPASLWEKEENTVNVTNYILTFIRINHLYSRKL